MKKLYAIILLLILTSCISTQPGKFLTPLWYSDSYDFLSDSKYIGFKAKGYSLNEAEDIVFKKADYLKQYINPIREKEFTNDQGEVFVLYSIKKKDLTSVFNDKLDDIYKLYSNSMMDGDVSSGILDKIKYYQEALIIYKDVESIVTLAESIDIDLDVETNFDFEDLNSKVKFTRDQIVFAVVVNGDINGSITSLISRELHKLGYRTSTDGIVQINAELTLTDAKLNNNYVNKYWNLQLSIGNLYGDNSDSLSFNGRESQIDEVALDQLIIRVVSENILDSLKSLIP